MTAAKYVAAGLELTKHKMKRNPEKKMIEIYVGDLVLFVECYRVRRLVSGQLLSINLYKRSGDSN